MGNLSFVKSCLSIPTQNEFFKDSKDMHGNTVGHIAVIFNQKELLEYLH